MRYFSFLTALMLTASLAACSDSNETADQDANMAAEGANTASSMADKDVLTGKPKSEVLDKGDADNIEPLPESDEPSPGMQMTLDGSSVQAFEDSMKVLQANMTAKEFNRLKTAVQYLSLYDFQNRGKDALYATLDDMTPDQVNARAKEVMNR